MSRFLEGLKDPSDFYANHNTAFFDVNMRALDGIQGPVYVCAGCLLRRTTLHGFDPSRIIEGSSCLGHKISSTVASVEGQSLYMRHNDDKQMNINIIPKKFGYSSLLIDTIKTAGFEGLPLADHSSIKNGRLPGALRV